MYSSWKKLATLVCSCNISSRIVLNGLYHSNVRFILCAKKVFVDGLNWHHDMSNTVHTLWCQLYPDLLCGAFEKSSSLVGWLIRMVTHRWAVIKSTDYYKQIPTLSKMSGTYTRYECILRENNSWLVAWHRRWLLTATINPLIVSSDFFTWLLTYQVK